MAIKWRELQGSREEGGARERRGDKRGSCRVVGRREW